MKKLRWGILSSAKIGRTHVIPALQTSNLNEVAAIASRDQTSADQVAQAFDIPQAYDSYDKLLADPTIDVIYNPLPNHLHVPWTIKAIAAGKHVLCEKPLGLNTADVQHLIDIAAQHPHIKVMEAFMYRFHPQWKRVRDLIHSGSIGQVRTIHSHFSYNNHDPSNIRNSIAMGGGALLDVGCYCISLARFMFNQEPLRVMGQITPYAGHEVDCFVSGILEFADGNATFSASTKVEPDQYAKITGELGSIYIQVPFNPLADAEAQITVKHNHTRTELIQTANNQYSSMADAFAESILQRTPVPTPLSDALANMKIIDGIFNSAQQNCWIDIE